MKYLRIFVILLMLVNVLHKAVAQGETTQATATPAANGEAGMTTGPTDATTQATATPAANGAAGMTTASPPAATQATTTAATPTTESGLAAIATYLNRKIRQELTLNPAKTEGSLARVFNAERSKLENARIIGTATDDAISQAERILRGFETFVLKYTPIDNMLQKALNDLHSITGNMKLPLEYRYMALMLQSKLGSSESLNDAERTIKQYNEFKNGQDSDSNGFLPTVGSPTAVRPPSMLINFPPLNDEYRKYFEEIIKILRSNLHMGSPQMTNLLQQILNNPQQVKQVLHNLKEVTEDIISDFFEDIFDFF